jgi:hypothetical protein
MMNFNRFFILPACLTTISWSMSFHSFVSQRFILCHPALPKQSLSPAHFRRILPQGGMQEPPQLEARVTPWGGMLHVPSIDGVTGFG